ncbi:hypothetical protein EWD33_19530 [Salmonella enterica subsp. enterica serovar Oranienburg]|nr:hypothetical protein [Salmonella enterica subsp. enterica serovar Oranienburg]
MDKPLRGEICTIGVDTEFCFTMMRKTLKLILKIADTGEKPVRAEPASRLYEGDVSPGLADLVIPLVLWKALSG